MQITTVGIDLAKNVFQIHGVNEHDRAMVRKQMRREQITAFFANLPPCSIRGLLAEYGLVVPQGIGNITTRIPTLLERAGDALPGVFRHLMERLLEHFKEPDRQVGELKLQIKIWHRTNEASHRLEAIPGIGPLTATAMVASIGNARMQKTGSSSS